MLGPVGPLEEVRPARSRRAALALLLAVAACPAQVSAGSFIVTIADTTGVRDTHLRQEGGNQVFGTTQELRVKGAPTKARNTLFQFPVTSLGNKTVLQAWLGLRQYAGSSSSPLDTRIYPVTEAWREPAATWSERDTGASWARPGGTRGPYWSGRSLVSAETNNSRVSWQVGPIMRAWQAGDLPNLGVLIEGLPILPVAIGATEAAPITISPEIIFRSREYTDPAQRPNLVVYYTDEPPAIQNGTAELQPNAVPSGAQDVCCTRRFDIDV